MLGVDHARFEIVDPILRIVVLLVVFKLFDEASVIITNVKLLACITMLLAARVIILVCDIHPLFALTASPCLSVALVSGLALVGH